MSLLSLLIPFLLNKSTFLSKQTKKTHWPNLHYCKGSLFFGCLPVNCGHRIDWHFCHWVFTFIHFVIVLLCLFKVFTNSAFFLKRPLCDRLNWERHNGASRAEFCVMRRTDRGYIDTYRDAFVVKELLNGKRGMRGRNSGMKWRENKDVRGRKGESCRNT